MLAALGEVAYPTKRDTSMQPPNGNNPFNPSQNAYGQPPSFNAPNNPFVSAQNHFAAQGPGGAAPQPPKKRSKLWLLLLAIPALACTSCLVFYLIDSHGHESASVLADVCEGQRSVRTAPYLPSALPHRIAWFNRSGSTWRHDGSPPVPIGWSTVWADEAQLVVCAEEPVRQVIERCPFNNGHVVERRQVQQGIRVVVPATGQVLFQQAVVGPMPQPCAQTEYFSRGSTTSVRAGDDIPEATIAPLIEPFVTR